MSSALHEQVRHPELERAALMPEDEEERLAALLVYADWFEEHGHTADARAHRELAGEVRGCTPEDRTFLAVAAVCSAGAILGLDLAKAAADHDRWAFRLAHETASALWRQSTWATPNPPSRIPESAGAALMPQLRRRFLRLVDGFDHASAALTGDTTRWTPATRAAVSALHWPAVYRLYRYLVASRHPLLNVRDVLERANYPEPAAPLAGGVVQRTLTYDGEVYAVAVQPTQALSHEEAFRALWSALDAPVADTPGFDWANLGVVDMVIGAHARVGWFNPRGGQSGTPLDRLEATGPYLGGASCRFYRVLMFRDAVVGEPNDG